MSNVDDKIERSLYCNDTSIWGDENYLDADIIENGWSDYRETEGAIDCCPIYRTIKGNPTTLCSKKSDAYKLKVGFLTVDEEILAGRSWNNGMQDYLYNNSPYWLGSPFNFYESLATMYHVYFASYPYNRYVNDTIGVRPVVTLLPNTNYTGSGTTTDPFVVN